jgi:hypothetical protein
MKRNVLCAFGIMAGLAVALLALAPAGRPSISSAAPLLDDVCAPPCGYVRVCEPTGAGMSCRDECQCPEGYETPAPGTAYPLPTSTPPPTPLPPNSLFLCVTNDCPPGESRPALGYFSCTAPSYCQFVGVKILGDCCDEPCLCNSNEPPQPCNPGASTTCADKWGASVSASLPVWYADRKPYPRTMVTLGTSFWVSDASGRFTTQLPAVEKWGAEVDPGKEDCDCAGGDCEDDPPPAGTVCNYKLGLKAEPAPNTPPTWTCEDAGGGYGYQASCTWNFSSAGKEYLGRGVECESLPAFAVRASVPYWWSFGRQYDRWEKVKTECQHWPGFGTAACDLDGDGVNDPDTKRVSVYGWKHHGPDWVLLDLRDYGYSTPYMLNPRISLAPYHACGPHPVGALYVPCIEVQGVISNPKEPWEP